MLQHLVDEFQPGSRRHEYETEEAERRLQQADETGSSALKPFGCTWDDSGLIYEQRGFLPRAGLSAFAILWGRSTQEAWDALMDLLEPFDADTPVRRTR